MNIKSTYDLLQSTLGYFGFSKSVNSNENYTSLKKSDTTDTIHMNHTETIPSKEVTSNLVDSPISADKPYRISSTPYKDALMKGLTKYKFKNRDYRYYQKLGNKINKIVDEQNKTRSHRYWWVDDYLRESHILNNKYLKGNEYCVVLSRKKLDKYKKRN